MGFSIDEHNEMVEKLWDDYQKRCNKRIPIIIACDEQFQLPLYGTTFRKYYGDPIFMANVQLETMKWWMNNVVQDARMGSPKENWEIHPQLWMAEKEYFGCEVVYQENDYAWAKPIEASKEDLLAKLRNIDPIERIKNNSAYRFYNAMKENFEGKRYNGQPIKVGHPGNLAGTHGLFTTAAEVRGHARLLAELRTDPEFVKSLLGVLSEKIIEHIKTWYQLIGDEKKFPSPDAWGMADDSLQMLSPKLYKDIVLPFHKEMYAEMTTGTRTIHLCGHSEQHFKTLYDELGIRLFDGPGPWIDIGWMRDEFGTDIRINAQIYHHKLMEGSSKDIESMISGILTKRAKRGGHMTLMGYAINGISMEKLEMIYKFGLKYGSVD